MITNTITTAAVVATFPTCPVKGHGNHSLWPVSEHTQDGTGEHAWTLECTAGGRYRFFYIPTVFASTGSMVRMTRPRYGWKAQ